MNIKKLEIITKDDLDNLYKDVNQEYCLVALPVPFEEDKANVYIEAIETGKVNNKEIISYGIYEDEELIGKVELTKIDNDAELDLVIKEKCENRGYGKKAIKHIEDFAIKNNWCNKIEAYVNIENKKMISILEASNYIKGNRFTADIMKENNGLYQLTTITGIEYYKEINRKQLI